MPASAARASHNWWVEVAVEGGWFSIEHHPDSGFCLTTTPFGGCDDGPDEFFRDATKLVERLVELVHTRSGPKRFRSLRELRLAREATQVALAHRLGVTQPVLSKIEQRDDVTLGVLQRYVEALGGALLVSARFGDETVELVLCEEPPPSSS